VSKKQWGHGYHKGIEEAIKLKGIVGMFFHSFDDSGKIKYQGVVTKDLENGSFMVLFFSWLDGSPTNQEITSFETMKDWHFYQTDKEMRLAWHREQGSSQEDIEYSEQFSAMMKRMCA
jgi:hypothetical protein